MAAARLDGIAERAADTGAVVGPVSQILAGLAVEDISPAAGRMPAEVLDAQIVGPQQRIDKGLFLGQAFGAVDLVLIEQGTTDVGILRSGGSVLDQLHKMLGGSVVILVVASLLEEVAAEDVLLTLLDRIAPLGVLRPAEILLGPDCAAEEQSGGNEQILNLFHDT